MKLKTALSTSALISAATLFSLGQASAAEIILDRIVAIADDGVVMQSELDLQIAAIHARLQAQNVEMPPADILQSQVLEHLIVQELQMQIAKRAGVTVSDEEINEAVADLQQRNGVSTEEFLAELQAQGMSVEDLRESLRSELILTRVQRGVLGSRLNVTEHDVDSFLSSQEGQFWTAPELQLGHILISVPSDAAEPQVAEALAKAENIYNQIQQGTDFSRLAVTFSAAQDALEGGNLGWRKPAQLPELFAEQVANLKVGDTTKPFRSGAGFHLLKIHEQRGGGQQIVQQTNVRHILVQPSVILSEDEARDLLADIRLRILNGADFAALAREHSKDPGSMLQGGDLGWSTPGQFVPQFEQAMNETALGDISAPFRSQHGWHILQVVDRRQEDMSETVIRNQAYNLLRGRRFEEELPIWLQEIRDEAYIDIKIAEIETTQ